MRCKRPEPAPTRFYAPADCFTKQEQQHLGLEVLGDRFHSPGFSFCYQVASGPLCRLYFDQGKVTPHAPESAWQRIDGKWCKPYLNYLSYQTTNGSLVTARWHHCAEENYTQIAA